MNGKLYIKKFIRDDGETLSFDAEEIYLSENNTLLVRSDPATTAVEFTEEDGGEMIRQRGATYSEPVSGLIVPKSTEYWALCVRLSRFFILNHTYKIVYIKRDGSMFSMNRAWINAGLQIVPVPYENYSTWTIEFRIGDNFWTEYAEDGQGKEIYSNTVELPLLTAGTGGEVWNDVTQQTWSGLGNYFTIDSTSISASINELEVRGDTYQQTYSGKNLWPIRRENQTVGQVTYTYNQDGTFSLSGDPTGVGAVKVIVPLASSGITPGQTYTIWTDHGIGWGENQVMYYIQSCKADGTWVANIATFTNAARTQTVASTDEQYIMFVLSWSTNGNYTNFNNVKAQLVAGSTADSDFEPYTAGSAPNPDYPQDIQVVTGEQSIKISSKNLQSIGNSTTSHGITFTTNADGSITINGTTTESAYFNLNNTASTYLKLRGGLTYTLSAGVELPQRVRLVTRSVSAPATLYMDIYGTDTSGATKAMEEDVLTFTYIAIYNAGTTVNNLTIYPQLEIGSAPTQFEKHSEQTYPLSLGNLELCKIGDYQDYIYKSGSDWFIHKDCGKITFNSSTGWAKHSTTQGNVFTLASTGLVGYAYGSGQIAPALMDTDRAIALGSMADNAYGVFGINNGGQLRVFRGNYDSSYTAAVLKSEMTGHYIYGALVQPTNTKITDTTLVAQLNALAGAQAYSGKTVYQTDSATMPAILSVELLQSVGGGEVWDNVGAVWEEGVGGVQTINVETTQTTYPVWTVTGPCSNPTLQNDTTDTIASFDGMIASGQTLTVDFADNTAYLDSAPVAKYVSGYVSLAPGENVIGFNSDGGSTQTSTISWDNIIN